MKIHQKKARQDGWEQVVPEDHSPMARFGGFVLRLLGAGLTGVAQILLLIAEFMVLGFIAYLIWHRG